MTSELPCCKAFAKVTALRGLVAGHAHWMSMMSRTAYSTWTPQKPTLFSGHYLRNRSTLDMCFGLYRYSLTWGTLSRSIAHSSWDTLYVLQLAMDGNYGCCYTVGCKLWHWEGRGKLFRFPRTPVWYVHKIIEQMYDHLFIYNTMHFQCQTEFINFHILTLMWSLNVVSCFIIRVAVFFFRIVQFSNTTNSELSF